jgi:PAS domain S-box-containing protein
MYKLIAIRAEEKKLTMSDVYANEKMIPFIEKLSEAMQAIQENKMNIFSRSGELPQLVKSIIHELLGYEFSTLNVITNTFPIMEVYGQLKVLYDDLMDCNKALDAWMLRDDIWKRIVDTSEIAIGVISLDGRIIYANEKTYKVLGFSKNEFVGQNILKFLDTDGRKRLFNQLHLQAANNDWSAYEVTWIGKDTTPVHTIVTPNPIQDKQDRNVGTYGMIVDITELSKAKGKIEVALEEKITLLEEKSKLLEEIQSLNLELKQSNNELKKALKAAEEAKEKAVGLSHDLDRMTYNTMREKTETTKAMQKKIDDLTQKLEDLETIASKLQNNA